MEHTVPVLLLAITVWLATVLGEVVPYISFNYANDPFVRFGNGLLGGDGSNWLYCTVPGLGLTIVQEAVGVLGILTATSAWLIGLATVTTKEELDTMVIPEVVSRPVMPRKLLVVSALMKYLLHVALCVNRLESCAAEQIANTFSMHGHAVAMLFLSVALFYATTQPGPEITHDDSRDKALFCATTSIVLTAVSRCVSSLGQVPISDGDLAPQSLQTTTIIVSFLIAAICVAALTAVLSGYLRKPCIVPPAVSTILSIAVCSLGLIKFASEILTQNPYKVTDILELVSLGFFAWGMALTIAAEKDHVFYRFRVERVNLLWARYCVVLVAVQLSNVVELCKIFQEGLQGFAGLVGFTGAAMQLVCVTVSSGRWFWMNNLELDMRVTIALSIGAVVGGALSFSVQLTVMGLLLFYRCVTASIILCRVLPPLRWGGRDEAAVYNPWSIDSVQSKLIAGACLLPLAHATTRPTVLNTGTAVFLGVTVVCYVVFQAFYKEQVHPRTVTLAIDYLFPILTLFFAYVLTCEYAWHYSEKFDSLEHRSFTSGAEHLSEVTICVRDFLAIFSVILLWPFCLVEDLPECDTSPSEHRWNSESDMEV